MAADLDVFTDIDIPEAYYLETMRARRGQRGGDVSLPQSVGSKFETTDFLYEHGILDYVGEIAGEDILSAPAFILRRAEGARPGGTSRNTK
jgi:DNA gyrase subunit B